MVQLQISTQHHSYPVVIGSGAIHGVQAFIQENMKEVTNIGIIIDEKVADIYWNDLKAAFNELPFSVTLHLAEKMQRLLMSIMTLPAFCLRKSSIENRLLLL